MKMIKCLLILVITISLCLVITNDKTLVTQAEDNRTLNVKNLKSKVSPVFGVENKTWVSLSWTTDLPMEELSVIVYLDINSGTYETPFSWKKDNSNCNWNNGEFIEDHYLYILEFPINSGKMGNLALKFEYSINGTYYDDIVYISTGNENVEDDDFTWGNSLIIGLATTIAAGFATFLIIGISEKKQEIDDEIEK